MLEARLGVIYLIKNVNLGFYLQTQITFIVTLLP